MKELIYDVYVDGDITETTSNKDYAMKLYVYYAAVEGRMVEVREKCGSERHRIMMLALTTLREVAVNNYPFILIVSAVYVVHALWGLV